MIRIYTILLLIIGGCCFLSCSDDTSEKETGDGNEIQIEALLTRADSNIYPDLHFRAYDAADPTDIYIAETPISVPAGLFEDTPNNVNFTNGTPYYPLGENDIAMYAYTGKLLNNEYVYLTSGKDDINDAILSNQGYRSGSGQISAEGAGTLGSSVDPATILQFRHLMTQINVLIEIDTTEDPQVDPEPSSIKFQMGDNIRLHGEYNIRKSAPDPANETGAYVAEALSGRYTIEEGVNYVVPNGVDIRDLAFTELVIDDYTATPEDLALLKITNVGGASTPSALLLPGYAYNLTFVIRRLEVQAIRIKKVDWIIEEVTNEDISFDPHVLNLDLGAYTIVDESDVIEKVVLFTSDGFEYVGGLQDDGLHFVNLPATDMVDSVSLYTSLGMLVGGPPDSYMISSATTADLTLTLSAGGMKLEDPDSPAGVDNPYLISTPVQIFNMYKEPGASYKQVVDIDVDRLAYTDDDPLVPLESFSGVFDGNGYRIQNLVMSGSGLVRLNTGILKNLFITSGRINATGEPVAGSFCAVNAGTIVACVNEARIVGATGIVGGICGINEEDAVVIACVNNGNLDSGDTLGGICGSNEDPDTYTFISCINTGLLAKTGQQLGAILGESVTSPNAVIRNSFWLVGTAAKVFGGAEVPVGGSIVNIGLEEVAALSPEKLRNDLSAREEITDAATTVALLNAALADTEWGDEYEYVLEQAITGSVWPVPVKK